MDTEKKVRMTPEEILARKALRSAKFPASMPQENITPAQREQQLLEHIENNLGKIHQIEKTPDEPLPGFGHRLNCTTKDGSHNHGFRPPQSKYR